RKVMADVGGAEPIQVVCGAWNFEEGDLVPWVKPGSTLPNGMEIGTRKMRGVDSAGMLCSPVELNLGAEAGGLMVLPRSLEFEPGSVGPSPSWVARRLTLAGMRPISNLVDASNYVMLELGQPTHPYDLDRLPGGGLLVRAARPGERLTTLDDVERILGDGPYP